MWDVVRSSFYSTRWEVGKILWIRDDWDNCAYYVIGFSDWSDCEFNWINCHWYSECYLEKIKSSNIDIEFYAKYL